MRTWVGLLIGASTVAGCSGSPSRDGKAHGGSAAATGVRLIPSPAFASSRIDVVFDDPWIDAAKCRYVWRRNDLVIQGAQGSSLEPTQFSRGQRISVAVSLEDSTGAASKEWAASVNVVNSPPKVSGVTLQVLAPSGSPIIQPVVQSADPDGDDMSYNYRWFRNGTPLEDANGPNLAATQLARGDRVAVEIVASDGQSSSPPFRSEPLSLENRPPQVTSQPHAPRTTDDAFRYQVVAVDLDGDPLHYDLVSAPEGMTLDQSGMVVWPLPSQAERHGERPVTIKVSDPKGGEAVQEFSIPLDATR